MRIEKNEQKSIINDSNSTYRVLEEGILLKQLEESLARCKGSRSKNATIINLFVLPFYLLVSSLYLNF